MCTTEQPDKSLRLRGTMEGHHGIRGWIKKF